VSGKTNNLQPMGRQGFQNSVIFVTMHQMM